MNQRMLQAKDRARRARSRRNVGPSRQLELWYSAELVRLVRRITRDTVTALKPALVSLTSADSGFIGDAGPMDLSKEISSLSKKFGGLRETAKRLAGLAAQRASYHTDKQLAEQIRQSTRIDITPILARKSIAGPLRKATKENVDLITSIPDQYLDKVRKVVTESYGEGLRWETISEKLQQVADVTESRAKLIARDQVSKMNGSFNEVRQTSLGIEEYTWQTSGDERVRESHAENDGKTFRWDDPPDETGHPGEDVNCRCTALPVFDLDKEEKALGIADE